MLSEKVLAVARGFLCDKHSVVIETVNIEMTTVKLEKIRNYIDSKPVIYFIFFF